MMADPMPAHVRAAILDLWSSGLFDTQDIATAMRVPESDVESAIHRAREASRERPCRAS